MLRTIGSTPNKNGKLATAGRTQVTTPANINVNINLNVIGNLTIGVGTTSNQD